MGPIGRVGYSFLTDIGRVGYSFLTDVFGWRVIVWDRSDVLGTRS